VITPFTIRDLRLLGQLQKDSVSLCPIQALTRPRSPVWTALMSYLPFDQNESLTYILTENRRDGKQRQGFLQARHPLGQPRVYVECLTPRLDAGEHAHAVWNRLLNHVVAASAEQGVQRVFACAADDSEELEVLLGAGFCVYTREDIYCLPAMGHPQVMTKDGIRPDQSTDTWDINQLYRAVTPHLVQQAESPAAGSDVEWLCGPVSWNQGEGLILEDETGIAGYGHLTPGRIGHWLTLLVHSRGYDEAVRLLDQSLNLLNYYPPYPVYCPVREYQGGIRALLEDRGFRLYATQSHCVKHTMAWVKEPVRSLVPGLEKRAEAPTTTVSSTKGS
jgi:hypothetical protein